MDTEKVRKALKELQKHPKRKFTQSYDLVINLKNIVIKQTPVDFFVTLHYPKGKKIRVAAFVDQLLAEQAQTFCDLAIRDTEFAKYADKKVLKKLAEEYDYFIAQDNLMPKVAAAFGKVLGTKGKMPNPKLGGVVPPTADLEPLVKKLNLSVKLTAKKATNLQCLVGKEDQDNNDIVDNVLAVYQA